MDPKVVFKMWGAIVPSHEQKNTIIDKDSEIAPILVFGLIAVLGILVYKITQAKINEPQVKKPHEKV